MTGQGSSSGRVFTPVDFDPFADAVPAAPFPLSEAQQEIWAVARMGAEESCVYNLCYALRLSGELSFPALTTATQGLFDRHEALRMVFAPEGPSQSPHASWNVDPPLQDLTGMSPSEREHSVARLLAQEVETPFDLVEGPLARVRVVREAADRHLLILTAHHIVCDGLSAQQLFRELAALYGAARRGEAPSLPAPVPFTRTLGSTESRVAETAAALGYWRDRFQGGVPALDLPTDRPRPALRTFRGDRETRPLDLGLSSDIRQAARAQGVTLVSFLFATFSVLLHRLSGQSDVVVGLPSSIRADDEDALVGHATSLLPVLVAAEPEAAFDAHVRATASTLLDAQDHRQATLGALVRELDERRDPSRPPLAAVTFNFDRGRTPVSLPGLEVELRMQARSHISFELELNVVDLDSGFVLECAYNPDLYSADTVQRWLRHYETLLGAAADRPETTLAALSLLTQADREQLAAWNATSASIPESCVHELISAQAGRTPGRVAVESLGESLTYAELNERSDALARRLRARGVKPGVRVGVFLERGLEMVVGVLGVLKAGGAYVPLDPAFPSDRLRYMVEDSEAAVLLTHAPVADEAPTDSIPVLRVDEEDEVPGPDTDSTGAGPDDLAYVIYTSGSTGKPKGVAVTHRNLVNFLESMRLQPGLGDNDVLLSVTTLSFDIATLELYLPLMTGARVVVASREQASDGHQLLRLLDQATLMQATPASWRLLLESGWRSSPGLKVLCGGEALPRELAKELLARAAEVWNVYGPTETTVWSSLWRVEDGEGPISIGRPIANTQMHVLDPHSSPQPVGVPGELYIGGAGVAHGYWKRPELTAERFIPDPFSQEPGARLYRTGDLARWLPDGRLECLGRIDHQVKVRGFRIELGEIETALERHPAVAQATVVVREDNPADPRLVAYLVGNEADTHPAELRQHLAQTLPDYMVPSAFALLDSFPLTPNGKVDRKALLQESPPPGGGITDDGLEPPRTDSERLLAGLWQELLGIDAVGRHDNFFDVGGHSLLAHRMAAQVEERTQKRIAFREVTVQTLESLAAGLDAAAPHTGDNNTPGLLGRVTGALKGLRSGNAGS